MSKKSVLTLALVSVMASNMFLSATPLYAAQQNSRLLKIGMRGDDVKVLQSMLKSQGYLKADVSGYFGSVTKDAVVAFQRKYKIKADGIVGPSTLNTLKVSSVKPKPVSRGTVPVPQKVGNYVVQPGDSLWIIANKFSTSVDKLKVLNNLSSDYLNVGQKINIPVSQQATTVASPTQETNPTPVDQDTATATPENTYTVQAGDSLWILSQKFGTTLENLKSINNLATDNLEVGQKLMVPAPHVKPASTAPAKDGFGDYADWWNDAQYAFPIGATAKITDVKTGLTFNVKRSYGVNHADCEPLTANDTAIMKKLYPQWSWNTRAIIVEVGTRKLAASMNGMPHSIQTIGTENDFNGHFCIHFLNSRNHNTNAINPDHQTMVKKAAGLS